MSEKKAPGRGLKMKISSKYKNAMFFNDEEKHEVTICLPKKKCAIKLNEAEIRLLMYFLNLLIREWK